MNEELRIGFVRTHEREKGEHLSSSVSHEEEWKDAFEGSVKCSAPRGAKRREGEGPPAG